MFVRSSSFDAGCGWRKSRKQHSSVLTQKQEDAYVGLQDFAMSSSKIEKSKSQSTRWSGGEYGDALSVLLGSSSVTLRSVDRLQWLRSQVIGDQFEFTTPFGTRELLYVDHTASGRPLSFIELFIQENVLPFYGNTHTDDSFVGQRTSVMVSVAAQYIKKQLGGTHNDALLFCGSGCTGALKRLQEVMGITVPSTLRSQMLSTLDEAERWVVFTGPYEHHSNLLSWRQSLAEVVEIRADDRGFIDLQVLETALKSPAYKRRLKIGSFSACSNVTGLVTDTRAIARLLHKHGAFVCFDFAASAPHVQIDMRSSEKDGYDAVVLSPHKFIGGPGTPGILLMRKTLYMLGKNPPSTCGGGTVSYVNGFNEEDTLYCKSIEEREDAGTPPIVQKVRCALAFWVKDFIGSDVIEHRETFFIKKALKRLSDNKNIKLLGNTAAMRAPVLSFLIYSVDKASQQEESLRGSHVKIRSRGKPLHGRFVVKLLNDLFGIQARGGCACAGPYGHSLLGIGCKLSLAIRAAIKQGYLGLKPGWARLSFSYDMTDEEVEYVLAAIELLAKYGQRFLPLYDFDWKTGDWTYRHTSEIAAHEQDLPSGAKHSQHLMFKHCLGFAKALAGRMPKTPPVKSIPADIWDPEIIAFRV